MHQSFSCRRKALMEVQCLAALGLLYVFLYFCVSFCIIDTVESYLICFTFFSLAGSHQNIVGYYSSWFESEHLYIQTELCDHSLSINGSNQPFSERELLVLLFQVIIIIISTFIQNFNYSSTFDFENSLPLLVFDIHLIYTL